MMGFLGWLLALGTGGYIAWHQVATHPLDCNVYELFRRFLASPSGGAMVYVDVIPCRTRLGVAWQWIALHASGAEVRGVVPGQNGKEKAFEKGYAAAVRQGWAPPNAGWVGEMYWEKDGPSYGTCVAGDCPGVVLDTGPPHDLTRPEWLPDDESLRNDILEYCSFSAERTDFTPQGRVDEVVRCVAGGFMGSGYRWPPPARYGPGAAQWYVQVRARVEAIMVQEGLI